MLSRQPVRITTLSFIRRQFVDEISEFNDALIEIIGLNAPALIDMKPSVVAQFSERTQVNPDVKYFTWAGECSIATVLFA